MLTYVGCDQIADVRAMLDPSLGALAAIPPASHITHLFRSRAKREDKAPIYENPAITTFSYMRRRKRFMRRAIPAAPVIALVETS